MGLAKSLLDDQDGRIALAAEYLVRKGLLKRCDAHEEIYGGGVWTIEPDFWPQAMIDRNRGASGLVPWAAAMSSKEFTDLLTDAYAVYNGAECGCCAKVFSE